MRISADLAGYRVTVENITSIPKFHSSRLANNQAARLANRFG
jgi:hypothetical protein